MKPFKPRIVLTLFVLLLILLVVIVTINSLKKQVKLDRQPEASTLAANAEISEDLNPPSSSESAKPSSIKDYIYTDAQIKNQTDNYLELVSTASADNITAWYKNQIKTLSFNAKSLTQTNTNGTVLNKLSAAKPGEKIDITIKKDQNSSNVMITVDRQQ